MSLRIGVSSCFFHADPERPIFKGKTLLYAEESMLKYVMRLGAKAYLVPRTADDEALAEYIDDLDGLVLQGGSDPSPKSYGEEPLKDEWSGDGPRDNYESALFNGFYKKKKPIFGICRGAQMLNVTFGGTLYQDLVFQGKTKSEHRDWNVYDENCHDIEVVEGTHLSALYSGSTERTVNSVHHQGLKDVAEGFLPSAFSVGDKVIEAIEHEDMQSHYVLGVQWHPEFHIKGREHWIDPDILMKDFLDACRK